MRSFTHTAVAESHRPDDRLWGHEDNAVDTKWRANSSDNGEQVTIHLPRGGLPLEQEDQEAVGCLL